MVKGTTRALSRGLLPLLILLAAVPMARAQYRAAVLGFSGPGAGQARRVVVGAFDDQFELERRATVESTAAHTGANLATPQGRAQVAVALRLNVMVSGTASGSRRRRRVTVVVYDAQGAELARRDDVRFGRGRAGRRRLERAATQLAQDAAGAMGRQAEAQRQRELADDRSEIARIDADAERPADEGPSEPSELSLLEFFVGGGFRNRNADITLATGATRVYESSFFPELSLGVVAHPFARSGGAAAGIFGRLEAAVAVGLHTTNDAGGQTLGTSASRLSIRAGYLARVGDLYVGGSLGYGLDSFDIDANDLMASADYSHLRLGLIGRVPILSEEANRLWFQLDVGLRVVLGTGDLAPMFAQSASATGFDVEGSFLGRMAFGLTYGLRFGLKTYSLSFEGMGAIPEDTAVGGSDTAVLITANVGYALR